MEPGVRIASSGILVGYLEAARGVGVDAYRIAERLGLPPAGLLDPNLSVPAPSMTEMFEAGAQLSGREDFAFLVARARGRTNLGPAGQAADEQATVGDAIRLFLNFYWLQDESIAYHLSETDDVCQLQFISAPWVGRQYLDFVFAMWINGFRQLCGPAWAPVAVAHPFPPPKSANLHRTAFGCVPDYNQAAAALYLEAELLRRPLPARSRAGARAAEAYVRKLAGQRRITFAGRARQLVKSLIADGDCSAEGLAQRLAVDRRTLTRRLAGENTSFSRVLDEARIELATALLGNSALQATEIAGHLGFRSSSAFAHWFRRNFHTTATGYRTALPEVRALRTSASAA